MSNAVLDSEVKQKTQKPPRYCVVMFNNDYTTFEFVQMTLVQLFNKTQAEAVLLSEEIHTKGKAIVGKNYSLDVANSKVRKAHIYAQSKKTPLECEVQPQEGDT